MDSQDCRTTDFQEALARAKTGDLEAAYSLFQPHQGALRAEIRRLLPRQLRPSVDPDDLLQTVFLKAFENVASISASNAIGVLNWLRAIAGNEIRDQQRRYVARKRGGGRILGSLAGLVSSRLVPQSSQRTPSALAIAQEERTLLSRAIVKLTARRRAILSLRRL